MTEFMVAASSALVRKPVALRTPLSEIIAAAEADEALQATLELDP